MPSAAPRISLIACLASGIALLSAAPAGASPDQGPAPKSTSASAYPSVHLGASAGVGWARERPEAPWRQVSDVRAEATSLGTPGLVLGLHGLYQSYSRSYATPMASASAAQATPARYEERRLDVGAFVGWDPLHSWADQRARRAGFVMLVTALDLEQYDNELAPLLGLEPGGGVRAFVRVVGPLTLRAGGACQWVMNLSPHASTARLTRGRPRGTLRYDAQAVMALTRFAAVDLGYAGESFAFEFESTQTHSLLLGVSLDG